MYKDSESPRKDFEKKPLPGTTASKPPAPKTPHAKPRGEGESDEAYAKRTANFAKSQERLKSVGITGGVNNASKEQLKAFSDKYGRDPSGLKPKDTTKPDMSAENPAKSKKGDDPRVIEKSKQVESAMDKRYGPGTVDRMKKQSALPSKFNKDAANQKAPNAPSKNITAAAAEKAMSSSPRVGRANRRKKRRLMQKKPMQGGML